MPRKIDPNEIADRAKGDVDPDLLTASGTGGLFNVGYFADGPLLDYLEPEEELHYLLSNLTKGLEIEQGSETERIFPGNDYRTAALITDRRILFVVGQDDGDHVVEGPIIQATSARAISGIFKNKIIVKCPATVYRMDTRRGDDTDAAAAYVETATGRTVKSTAPDESEDKGAEMGATDADRDSSDDESLLPASESVAALNKTAVQHVVSARTLLANNAGEHNHADLVRAHTELCTALDRLKPADGSVVEKIKRVVTVLESDLSGNASTPKTDGGNPTPNDEQSADPEKREQNPEEDMESDSEDISGQLKSRSSSGSRGGGPRFSKEDVLKEIRGLTEQLGHTPSTVELKEYGRMSPTPVYRHFSGWSEALEAAGVTGSSSMTGASGGDTAAYNRSTGWQTSTSDTKETDRTEELNELSSNELAELYDAFRRFQNLLEILSEEASPECAGAMHEWYQTVYSYWGESGPAGAPNYGIQQRDRNEFSIREYRDAYGDGDSVTDYHHIELVTAEGKARLLLGDRLEGEKAVVPVAPDSGTALPLLITDDELENAKQLLSEFPAYPDADVPRPEDVDADEDLSPSIPEGRVEALDVTVLEREPDPGSRKDARLWVRTGGMEMLLEIWSTHNITVDWTVGETYTLKQPRYKSWKTSSGVQHKLSSTKDLQIYPSKTGSSGTSSRTSGDDKDEESGDIVDTIMDDIDLGGES